MSGPSEGKSNHITVIYGMKGSGKSYYLEQYNGLKARVLWVDLFGLYKRMGSGKFREKFPGWERLHDNLPHAVRTMAGELAHPALVAAWRASGGQIGKLFAVRPKDDFRLMYTPPEGDEGIEEEHLAILWEALKARYDRLEEEQEDSAQQMSIVMDEVDGINRGNSQPSKTVARMIKRGRHILLDQWYATRRPHELPRLVSSQSDETILFRTEEDRDLDYLEERGVPKLLVRGDLPNMAHGEYYRIAPQEEPRITHYLPPEPICKHAQCLARYRK